MVKENNNVSVCEIPMPEESPQPIMRGAGLQPKFRHLVRQYRPEVNLVGPEQIVNAGRTIMISGRGFTPESKVYVGGRQATNVKVLTTNFIFAKAPANDAGGTVPVVVTNAQGKSKVTEFSQLTYTAMPLPCQASLGTGITTAILS
jgi:hypothetical protein